MAKVVKFPSADAQPAKLGLQRAHKRCRKDLEKLGQLNLFNGARIISLHQLLPFEEALFSDERGNLEQARKLYTKAIEEGDCPADAYCNLGIIEFQTGHHTKAIDCLTLSLKHDPRHYESHYNLANLYAEVGNYALAKIHYQIAIEIEPAFTNSYFNLGLTLAMNNEYKEAVAILKRYRYLTPNEEHHQTDNLIKNLSGAF